MLDKKDDYIKIRVSTKQKEEIQKIAYEKHMSMTEILLYGIMKIITESELKKDETIE